MTHGRKATLQGGKDLLLCKVAELLSEALEISEDLVIDDADETEQLEQRVLQRRCGEKNFGALARACFSVLARTFEGL